jgi:hypothetical protein
MFQLLELGSVPAEPAKLSLHCSVYPEYEGGAQAETKEARAGRKQEYWQRICKEGDGARPKQVCMYNMGRWEYSGYYVHEESMYNSQRINETGPAKRD